MAHITENNARNERNDVENQNNVNGRVEPSIATKFIVRIALHLLMCFVCTESLTSDSDIIAIYQE